MKITPLIETRTVHHKYERWNRKHTKVLSVTEYDREQRAFQFEAFGETRVVWATAFSEAFPGRYSSEYVFASMTRHGSKVHKAAVMFEIKPDGLVSIYNNVSLNRQTRIVGWWKTEYDTNGMASEHVGG